MTSRARLASERSRLASYVLLGIDRDKQVIPLPAQEQDGQLVFFQLTRGVLIVFERFTLNEIQNEIVQFLLVDAFLYARKAGMSQVG